MQLENYTKFIKYFGNGYKKDLLIFGLLSFIAGIMEFAGIAIVYPFILFIIKPETVINSKAFMIISKYFPILATQSHINCAFILGFLAILIFIVKNLFMIACLYIQTSFAGRWKADINKRFMRYFLYAPYKKIMKTTASSKNYILTVLTSQTLDLFIIRGVNLLINALIIIMILGLLLIKFPLSATFTGAFVILCMIVQNKLFKKELRKVSQKFAEYSKLNNDKIYQIINSLKEIKIFSAEKDLNDIYINTQQKFVISQVKTNFINSIPPYMVEMLTVVSLLILAGIISVQNGGNASALIASYAVVVAAIFRIAPALNRVQTSINAINSSRELVKQMINEYEHYDELKLDNSIFEKSAPLNFEKDFELKNVNFAYEEKMILKNINLKFKKGEFIGIIGSSGAGKTTLSDVISGLLSINSGEILVDGNIIDSKNIFKIRKLISYVPQEVKIMGETIKDNICWGIEEKNINEEKINEVLINADLQKIVKSYEHGINEKIFVGDTGLSQGQKQRVSLARAMYKDSPIMILDEATSALDVETEKVIVDSLNKLKGEKTIISIAHRLSTLKSCDRLIYMKHGEIVDIGTFEELENKHQDFEELIKLSNID